MNISIYTVGFALVFVIACGQRSKEVRLHDHEQMSSNINQNHPILPHTSDLGEPQEISKHKEEADAKHPPRLDEEPFLVEFGGLGFTAKRDGDGYATIFDYPPEWRGKARLTRFDGSADDAPFSKEHCEIVRAMNRFGGGVMARSAFHSLVKLEVPPFLSAGFLSAVADAARKSEIYAPIFSLKNGVQRWQGTLDLKLSDASISLLYGHLNGLNNQFNLARTGMENKFGEYELIITAGDILCDLVSGDATIIMSFPVEGEDRAIKVTYEKLQVTL